MTRPLVTFGTLVDGDALAQPLRWKAPRPLFVIMPMRV